MEYLLLVPLGFVIGAFGTLIGAGGGFILMPILLLAYPREEPARLTAISLAVVFFNAASGTWSYARMKRVDFQSGLWFLVSGVPGAIVGAYLINYVPRAAFDLCFGLLLLAGGIFIWRQSGRQGASPSRLKPTRARNLFDAAGGQYQFSYNLKAGMGLSFLVGLASSILGIGGGIIHVPIMVNLLNFPVHLATATSHFILSITALAGCIVHIFDGSLRRQSAGQLATLAAGAVLGAWAGAYLSSRIQGRWIMRGLALALSLVGIRILVLAVSSAHQAG